MSERCRTEKRGCRGLDVYSSSDTPGHVLLRRDAGHVALAVSTRLSTLGCAEDAVREALSLWEERERRRAEILAAVDTAETSIARGEGRAVTQQSTRELADEVKQRGRLDAERQTPR